MPFIKWDRPRGSVHDVAKALALSGNEHCNVLFVSDATLYVLQNWTALDLTFKARWADEVFDHGYIPLAEESPNYSAWVDLVEKVQGEVIDMSCEILPALEDIGSALGAIKDSIDALATEQAAWDDLLTDLLLPLAGMATGTDMALMTAALRDQQLGCCDSLADRPYYPVDPDPVYNPETSTFCQRADSFAWDWFEAALETFTQAKTIGQIGLGVISIIVAALSLPIAAILAIVAAIAGGIAELTLEDYQDAFAVFRDDFRCIIRNSGNAEQAKEALDDYLLSQVDGVSSIDMAVLRYMVSQEALNQVFLETYPIRPGSISNCSDCIESDCAVPCQATGFTGGAGSGSLTPNGVQRTLSAVNDPDPNSSRCDFTMGCNRWVKIVSQSGMVDYGPPWDEFRVWGYTTPSTCAGFGMINGYTLPAIPWGKWFVASQMSWTSASDTPFTIQIIIDESTTLPKGGPYDNKF